MALSPFIKVTGSLFGNKSGNSSSSSNSNKSTTSSNKSTANTATSTKSSGTTAKTSGTSSPTVNSDTVTVLRNNTTTGVKTSLGTPSVQANTSSSNGNTSSSNGNTFSNLSDDTATTATTKSSGGGSGGYSSSSSASSTPRYTAPTLPTATSQESYINALYKANQDAQEQALKSAYEKNTAALDYEASKLPATYDTAANQAAAQAAIQRANFNESANANGLNTGAGSQANLSMRNAEAANINAIRKEQANAVADIENQRAQLTLEYQNAIKDAIAQNEADKAQALYDEAKRVDESLVSTAVNQANLDWSVWKQLYG